MQERKRTERWKSVGEKKRDGGEYTEREGERERERTKIQNLKVKLEPKAEK